MCKLLHQRLTGFPRAQGAPLFRGPRKPYKAPKFPGTIDNPPGPREAPQKAGKWPASVGRRLRTRQSILHSLQEYDKL